MTPRLIIAALVCVLLAVGAWLLLQPASPAAAIARSLAGERWYSLELDGRHLGYWHTENGRDQEGNWTFESEQRFAMNPYDAVSTVARRTFSARPPHPLIRAEHLQTRREQVTGVQITASETGPTGYVANHLAEGMRPVALDWQYTLADYLDFELWLAGEQPASGRTRTVPTLDFERTDLVKRSFDVVARNVDGYVIENAAPLSATRIQLDNDYVPVSIAIAGLFSLRLASREQALAPRSTLQAASYYIPTDRRLIDHTNISRLVLAVEGHDAPEELFEEVERHNERWQLTLEGSPTTRKRVIAADLAATLNIPSAHPEIASLAEAIVRGVDDDLERARALVRFVHEYLSYHPGIPPQGVLGLLTDQRGDCTEFADLLTTLARSIGLPSRTVFGLAYADGSVPAFAYHAWNEVFIEDSWIAMDPTWGQDRVDATHIPLPADESAALKLLTGSVNLTFSVLDVEHFAD